LTSTHTPGATPSAASVTVRQYDPFSQLKLASGLHGPLLIGLAPTRCFGKGRHLSLLMWFSLLGTRSLRLAACQQCRAALRILGDPQASPITYMAAIITDYLQSSLWLLHAANYASYGIRVAVKSRCSPHACLGDAFSFVLPTVSEATVLQMHWFAIPKEAQPGEPDT
jgi:hypothetical protein